MISKYIKKVGHRDSIGRVPYEIRMKCLICGEVQTMMYEIDETEGMSDGFARLFEEEFCEYYGRHTMTQHYDYIKSMEHAPQLRTYMHFPMGPSDMTLIERIKHVFNKRSYKKSLSVAQTYAQWLDDTKREINEDIHVL